MSNDFSDDQLVALAVQHEKERSPLLSDMWENVRGFPVPKNGPPVSWVKYDTSLRLLEEADTQEYIYEALKQRPELSEFIRVPKVYRSVVKKTDNYYRDGHHRTWVLIEMEYVHGRTIRQILPKETSEAKKHLLWDRVVLALGALLTLEPSKKTSLGPEGGGSFEHIIFGDYCEYNDAPQNFDSVEELQNHINNTIVSINLYVLVRYSWLNPNLGK